MSVFRDPYGYGLAREFEMVPSIWLCWLCFETPAGMVWHVSFVKETSDEQEYGAEPGRV